MAKNYRYLTRGNLADGSLPFISRLSQELSKAQKKAPPSQWQAFIKGLTNKGVKGSEIDESKVIPWLENQEAQGVSSISRSDLLNELNKLIPIIKELDLSKPVYGAYRHKGDNERDYKETLYIWNSEKECYEDRLAEIRFEIEELDFNLELLAENPDRAVELYEEQQSLISKSKTAKGHSVSHFSGVTDPDTGAPIVNLISHARTSLFDDVFFVQEIQSDWAQAGRRESSLIDGERVPAPFSKTPKGPFVTSTDLWAGMILRRLMQRAAQTPGINRFAWIVGSMRNGGRFVTPDKLDNFYKKIMPKIADRALSGTGVKTSFVKVKLGNKEYEVPGFDITDKVREKLTKSQPLYSRDVLKNGAPKMTPERQAEIEAALKEAHEMLGSNVSIRLASKVLDAATGKEVAGYQLGRVIEASLNARNPALVIPHESWHYAYEHLLGPLDREAVDRAFENGTYLNKKVRMALVKDGAEPETVGQCDDAREAAAHGFSLWSQGKMHITPEKEFEAEFPGRHTIDKVVGTLFRKVERAFMGLSRWLKRKIGETQSSKDIRRVDDVFETLKSGMLAEKKPEHHDHQHQEGEVVRMRMRA